jgi:hypothetical protein
MPMRQHICGQQADTCRGAGPPNASRNHRGRDGVAVHGAYLKPVREARTVRLRASEVLVTDGPFAETKEQIGGYDVIECADLGEAIAVASRHPVARIGTIEVRPLQQRADDR